MRMNSVAAIVLNRNLPEVTDRLCEHLEQYDAGSVDCYVVEAGSGSDRLSRHATWYADWPEAREHGLRYARGMNFGLAQLWKEGRFAQYDAFLLLTNDTELSERPTVAPLLRVFDEHPRVANIVIEKTVSAMGRAPFARQGSDQVFLVHSQQRISASAHLCREHHGHGAARGHELPLRRHQLSRIRK